MHGFHQAYESTDAKNDYLPLTELLDVKKLISLDSSSLLTVRIISTGSF